ncbi:DUF1116 domain-containing protein [Oxalobacteraceae bacterium CAVE-383]|nr:DUF1116 domain-containing protein [Oxalobacteraceae bacterium CAVE-383]
MSSISFTTPANRHALDRLTAVRPAWTAVRTARHALDLPDLTLLHAGPPLNNPCAPPAPLLSSAVLCCLYEGWAKDEAQAEALIAEGRVALVPAQAYGAVTPLAAVISPRATLVEITDLNDSAVAGRRRAWSLLGSGAGPQLRFGSRDPAILSRMAWRDGLLADSLAAALKMPLELLEPAAAGLAAGDDLHAATTVANACLRSRLLPDPGHGCDSAVVAMLANSPLFFLTLWMAACHLMLDAAADGGRDAASTLVVALAGNGEQVGIRLAGQPERWFTAPATAPAGPRLQAAQAGSPSSVSPVLGDSGVIDAAGFGGQALRFAPEINTALQRWLPEDWAHRPRRLLAGEHAAFGNRHAGLSPFCIGLDAALAARHGIAPLAAIAMLDAAGKQGLLGRGLYIAPVGLFAHAAACILGGDGVSSHNIA